MKQNSLKNQDFGTFRIAADGRVFVRDLALLQAIREELHQEVMSEKVTTDVIHAASMPQYSPVSYSTLA
jgi:phage terminase large subunit